MTEDSAKAKQTAMLTTPTGLGENARKDISASLTTLLADFFALYIKTKNFHWRMSGPHFRDYHLMLDDQGTQVFAASDAIAERCRKLGGTTLRSIGHIAKRPRLSDNNAEYVTSRDMLNATRGAFR